MSTEPIVAHPTTESHAGWHLAVQSYTFKKFNLLQTIEKAAQLGVDFLEVYPKHKTGLT